MTFTYRRRGSGIGGWVAGIVGALFILGVMVVSVGLPVWLILEIIDYLHRH